MISLRDKTALVTGASRGLGRQIALFLAEQGCHLVLHARQLSNLESVTGEARQKGVDVHTLAADLSDPLQVESMLQQLLSDLPAIDVLINNAGFQVAYREAIWDTPAEDFSQSFQVNTIAPAMICYRLMPSMLERKFGRVVNITSGIQDEPEQAGYAASKAALSQFTRDLSVQLEGTNVLINLVDPGWCRTDLGGSRAPAEPASILPGALIPAFINDGRSGRLFRAQNYSDLTLQQAVGAAESRYPEAHLSIQKQLAQQQSQQLPD